VRQLDALWISFAGGTAAHIAAQQVAASCKPHPAANTQLKLGCFLCPVLSCPVLCCRHFFEALYSSLAAVLDEAFDRVGKQQAIHQELDRLFR
jgi:hypothetical protein